MPLTKDCCTPVILAGGASRRMGTCKALLKINGETMLSRILRQLSEFDRVLLSTGDPTLGEGLSVECTADLYPGMGPLAGLHAAFCAVDSEALLVLPCDLPFFTKQAAEYLLDHMPEDADALVCMDSTGRIHPLCGIYRRSVLPALEARLKAGELRVMSFLYSLNWKGLQDAEILPDKLFINVNSPEIYREITETP
jgi:molybdopterin-guanine dinucleotide biosynthesis protein A